MGIVGAGFVGPVTLEGVAGLLEGWLGTTLDARAAMGAAAKRLFETRFTMEAAALDLEAALSRATTEHHDRS